MHKFGDIVLASVQFTDTFEIKRRPALILFEECGNVIVMGITSNKKMKGVPILKKDGAITDSIIKINYIFTISEKMVEKVLFRLTDEKKNLLKNEIIKRLN